MTLAEIADHNQFFQIERTYDLASLVGDPADQLPLDVEERQFTRSTLISEREANDWKSVFVRAIAGIPPLHSNMPLESIGMLRGRSTTYDIRKEVVLLGRSTKSRINK